MKCLLLFQRKLNLLLFSCICMLACCLACEKKTDDPTPKSSEKSLIAFRFEPSNNAGLTGQINGSFDVVAKTVNITLPVGTSVAVLETLKGSFELSDKATLKVGGTVQISGQTPNDFSKPIVFTVTAEDGTTQDYTVTVRIAPPPQPAPKSITAFKFERSNNSGLANDVNGTITGTTITVSLPVGTNAALLKTLKASFELSDKATLKVGNTVQSSGQTANDFSKPLTFTVTAEDNGTQNYTVTVRIALPQRSSQKNITAFKFERRNNSSLANDIKGTIIGTRIAVILPTGTNLVVLSALKASFELSDKATLKVGNTVQSSGQTVNSFNKPLTFTVTAEDNSTQNYTVNIIIGVPPPPARLEEGSRNLGFKYFYYPKDNKIYYADNENIYRMDLDGTNNVKVAPPSGVSFGSIIYLYVHKDTVYFGDGRIYLAKTDGTWWSQIASGYQFKMLKITDDKAYFVDQNGDLRSIARSGSRAVLKVVEDCKCFMGKIVGSSFGFSRSGDYHIRGQELYYHRGYDGLWKVDLRTGAKTQLSSGKYDNYVFTKDYIYFRNHAANYSISRADYNLTNITSFRRTAAEVKDGFGLNVSSLGVVYAERRTSALNLNFITPDGSSERVLLSLKSFDDERFRLRDIKLIGNWVYYLGHKSSTGVYRLYRVKNDGTNAALIKEFK